MRKPLVTTKAPAEQVVKDIRRARRKLYSSEEKIRIVLSGLRGEDRIADAVPQGRYRTKLVLQRLCCTNPIRDSSRESSVIAGVDEQTEHTDLQNPELARV